MASSMITLLRAAVAFVLWPAVLALSWSPSMPDHKTIYACEGQNVSFPWLLVVDTNEAIVDTQWFFNGGSRQMIAMYASGNFLTMPTYAQRVQYLPTAGIRLSHVTPGDAGDYVVEVNARDAAGIHNDFHRTATLVVHKGGSASAVLDATMDVALEPTAVYDALTGESHVQLTCRSRGQTPSSVQWISPSGATLPSTSSSNGVFSLQLPNPAEGGSYRCRLSPGAAASTCLPPNSPALLGGAVLVDETQARLLALEAQQGALRSENNQLKTQMAQCSCGSTSTDVTSLTQALEAVKSRVAQLENSQAALTASNTHITADNAKLKQDNANLTSQLSSLQTTVHDLYRDLKAEDARQAQLIASMDTKIAASQNNPSHPLVSFHARLEYKLEATRSQEIAFRDVLNNNGGAYDQLSGHFTAPVDGNYFFISTLSSHSRLNFSDARIVKQGLEVAKMDSPVLGDVGTCQAVVHMLQGERVCVESTGNGVYTPFTSTFSGFLIG